MKKNLISCDITRLENIISDDRMNIGGNFKELVLADVEKILSDYFDLISYPTLTVSKADGNYFVHIECSAIRVKPFGTVPK